MKNLALAAALATLLAGSASAKAVQGPAPDAPRAAGPGSQTAAFDSCDRLYNPASPAWRVCKGVADASSLICGREPQLDICKRGQTLLSSATGDEQYGLLADASLICGTEPQLSLCKRGRLLSANDVGLLCGAEPQLSICRRGPQPLTFLPRCLPGQAACATALAQAAPPPAEPRVKVAEASQLRASAILSFDGEAR